MQRKNPDSIGTPPNHRAATPGQPKTARKEARRFVRWSCEEDTHFSTNRQLFEGTIKDMSLGGTYIATKGRFNVGQDIIVAGPFEANRPDVKRYGRIVRSDGSGIGVKFSFP